MHTYTTALICPPGPWPSITTVIVACSTVSFITEGHGYFGYLHHFQLFFKIVCSLKGHLSWSPTWSKPTGAHCVCLDLLVNEGTTETQLLAWFSCIYIQCAAQQQAAGIFISSSSEVWTVPFWQTCLRLCWANFRCRLKSRLVEYFISTLWKTSFCCATQ